MRCLLVLAMLSFSTAIAVLSIEEKTMEDKEMIPEKELMWKKGVKEEKEELTWKKGLKKMGERRSEPPSYMFHMLEQFSKEGRRGFARSILPMKGDGIFPAQFIQSYQKHKKEHSGFHPKKCNYHCINCDISSTIFFISSELTSSEHFIKKIKCTTDFLSNLCHRSLVLFFFFTSMSITIINASIMQQF